MDIWYQASFSVVHTLDARHIKYGLIPRTKPYVDLPPQLEITNVSSTSYVDSTGLHWDIFCIILLIIFKISSDALAIDVIQKKPKL